MLGHATAQPQRLVDDVMEEWRRAARRVERAWNAWLAADRDARPDAHAAYLAALEDEEQAARRVAAGRPAPLSSGR
jgi:hypothetical protein